jgi:cytochrome P450/NADPH-cytochrome P450 reductase
MTEAIPGPYALPFIGNILDLRHDEGSLKAFERLAEIYGPIYQVHFGGKRHIVCSSAELMAELTDEKYFVKTPPRAIANQQGAVGLFAAQNEDPDWGQAHRILVPAFGPLPIGNMFDGELAQNHALICA